MDLDPEIIQQLLATFAVELDEQVQLITDELLRLERGLPVTQRTQAYETVFRAAHNVKGAARGIGSEAVCDLAHKLETLFAQLKRGEMTPPSALIDVSLTVLDGMRKIQAGWRMGEPLATPLETLYQKLIERLHRLTTAPTAAAPVPAAVAVAPPPAVEATPVAEAAEEPPEPAAAGGGELLRVDLGRMRTVSGLTEEMEVTKAELHEHLARLRLLDARLGRVAHSWRPASPLFELAARSDNPELFAALHEQMGFLNELRQMGSDIHKAIRGSARRFHQLSDALQHNVRMLRLVRASNLLRPLVRSVRDMSRGLGKSIRFEVEGDAIEMDRIVLDGIKDPLTHLLRNAIDHGIESPEQRRQAGKPEQGVVRLTITAAGARIHLRLEDDGRGIDPDAIAAAAIRRGVLTTDEARLLDVRQKTEIVFRPGFSSKEEVTDISGRGVGLDVVKANIQSLKGLVHIESEVGKGTTFLLDLPLTLATEQGLVVRVGDGEYVVPETAVEQVLVLAPDELLQVEATEAVMHDGRPVPLRDLGLILESGAVAVRRDEPLRAIVVSHGWRQAALLVDDVVRDREIVVKRLGWPLLAVRNVRGAALTGTGSIMMVLNPADLIAAAYGMATTPILQTDVEEAGEAPHVLVVDDSITTRTLERNILEKNGYRVTVATHGRQAWEVLQSNRFDLIVTDVEMPFMDGFELTAKIKQSEMFRDIPVVIVTSLGSEKDKRRGIEVGADGYIIKSQFETGALLDMVRQLV